MNKHRFTQVLKNKIPARWHMSLICMTTIVAGIIFSKLILWSDLAKPMYRYGFAVLFSYGVFFVLIYWWLRINFADLIDKNKMHHSQNWNGLDVGAVDASDGPSWQGQGGHFSGAGASESWHSGSENKFPSTSTSRSIDFLDLDEGLIIVLFIAAMTAIFGSAGYLIYQAPEILFEAAFEVVLAAGLVKQAKKLQSEGWHYSIFKRTWWLCALILISSMILGFAIEKKCPPAMSFSQYRELCWNKDKNW